MKANKKTAYISGVVVTLAALLIERNGYNFAWVAVFFFPGLFVFTVGFEPWRSWLTDERTSLIWPSSSASWSIMRAAWFRMFAFFFGACSVGLISIVYARL